MNILRISYEWPPPWLGLVPHPFEVTSAQSRLGHKITVFCGSWPNSGKPESIPNVNLRTFFREPISGTLALTIAPAMFIYYLYWRLSNRPDVIHAHGHFGIWIFFYRKLLKYFLPKCSELKIPLVAHFHIIAKSRWEKMKEKGEQPKFVSGMLTWPLEIFANQLASDVADACIFVGEELRSDAIKYYKTDPAKCYIVESGVNPALFKKITPDEQDKTRKELGLIPHDKVILNYGALVERKNIHLLIEALALLPLEYKLILLGDGDEAYMERLNERVRELNLSDRFIKIGYTPYPSIPVAIQAADIFVLPSKVEGFPKVVMEVLSCGVPALVSGFKAQDVIEGLVYLEDLAPEKIAEQIKHVVDSSIFVDTQKIAQRYSWDAKAAQINQIYEKILSKAN